MKIKGDEIDLLPEEMQAEAIVAIKNILEQVSKTGLQKEALASIGLKLDALIETIREANNMSYRHDITRDSYGKAEYLITSPIKTRLKVK